MMEIEPQMNEPHVENQAGMHEQNLKEIYHEQQPTQKQIERIPEQLIPPITARPEPTPQQLRRRKQMRRREIEERQTNQFLKQPVIKIPNLKKNLKRAYEKNFFDDAKYQYIHALRKLRKHPERDSVSSHYGSDESFDIKEHLPKRGFQKRKLTQEGQESSDSDSQKETRKRKAPRQRNSKPRVKKENLDSNGQPKPPKPRKPRAASKPAKPTIKIANTTKPKPEAKKVVKDEAKEQKKGDPDQSSSEQELQSDSNSNSQLSSEKKLPQKVNKEPTKIAPIPNKTEDKEKKELPMKLISEKPVPIPQQIPAKKLAPANTVIAPTPKSNLLPLGIAMRPDSNKKIETKPPIKQSDSQTSSSQSSSSSSQSSSSDSDSSSDNRRKKKRKHSKSKKHRESSSESSDHSKRKKKQKKRKYEESSTFKESKKQQQPKEEPRGKIQPEKALITQSKNTEGKIQTVPKQPSNVIQHPSPSIITNQPLEKQPNPIQSSRKESEISNKAFQQAKNTPNNTTTPQKAFKLESQSLALTLSHKQEPTANNSQPAINNTNKEGVTKGNAMQIKQANNAQSSHPLTPINQQKRPQQNSKAINNQTTPNPQIKVEKEHTKEAELKFDPKVVVLSLLASSPSTIPTQKMKERQELKESRVRKPPPPRPPAKPKAVEVQEISDGSSEQSYISYRKRARYPRQRIVRLRKVIVQSESDFDSSSSQGYVQRRVIKRVKRPTKVVLGSSSDSQNNLDYHRGVRVIPKTRILDHKMSKGQR